MMSVCRRVHRRVSCALVGLLVAGSVPLQITMGGCAAAGPGAKPPAPATPASAVTVTLGRFLTASELAAYVNDASSTAMPKDEREALRNRLDKENPDWNGPNPRVAVGLAAGALLATAAVYLVEKAFDFVALKLREKADTYSADWSTLAYANHSQFANAVAFEVLRDAPSPNDPVKAQARLIIYFAPADAGRSFLRAVPVYYKVTKPACAVSDAKDSISAMFKLRLDVGYVNKDGFGKASTQLDEGLLLTKVMIGQPLISAADFDYSTSWFSTVVPSPGPVMFQVSTTETDRGHAAQRLRAIAGFLDSNKNTVVGFVKNKLGTAE